VTRFAFVIHPLTPRDAARALPIARFLPDRVLELFLALKSPVTVSKITGVRSRTGAMTEGWFIGCPLTPRLMTRGLPLSRVYQRLTQCTARAAELGADLIGLGAFTSVVGDGGITVRNRSSIGVTTGNSYTVATAIEGTVRACQLLDLSPRHATLAVVGATGSIGRTCAQILAPQFARTLLIGRDPARTESVAKDIPNAVVESDFSALRHADAVITVTSSESAIIKPGMLKEGAVVCDVARPRDVSTRVATERPDVLVIEGGMVRVPGTVDFGFNFGFPAGTAYACMSETMLLALEGDPSQFDFTLGKSVSVEQVNRISQMAERHGFELAGFRAFETAVDARMIERARLARIPAVARLAGRGTPGA
jgi:predicted amino acid dehydrogenase